jgi:peroxiredoxin
MSFDQTVEEEVSMTANGPREIMNRNYPAAGDLAPAFALTMLDGEVLESSELLRRGPVILTFYRGAWCRCCQADLRDIMDTMPELERTGVTVLGVFNDLKKEGGTEIVQEYGLTFDLAGDAEGRTAEAFSLRRTADEVADLEREFGAVPRSLKDDEPWILPMQARFAIRADGVIAKSDVVSDYHARSGIADLIPLLVSGV